MITPVDLRAERVADLAMIGAGMIAELASMFRSQVDADLPPLLEAIRGQKAGDVERIAHRLKGSASQMGMEILTAYLEIFIGLARIGEVGHAQALVPGFRDALLRAQAEFDAVAR